jgi:hypothetical protein
MTLAQQSHLGWERTFAASSLEVCKADKANFHCGCAQVCFLSKIASLFDRLQN